MEPTGQVYTDQTGRFITPSSNGNNYLLILYDYDSNCHPRRAHQGPHRRRHPRRLPEAPCRPLRRRPPSPTPTTRQ
ncbi:MAG: hypothetical protein MZV70_62545 [Desulfobacterales bacterium]|nr:hypothetical protein [Desulfobacterales bacterium]